MPPTPASPPLTPRPGEGSAPLALWASSCTRRCVGGRWPSLPRAACDSSTSDGEASVLRNVRLLPSRSSPVLLRGLAPSGVGSGVGLSLSGSPPALGRRFCRRAGSRGSRDGMSRCKVGSGAAEPNLEEGKGSRWAWVGMRAEIASLGL